MTDPWNDPGTKEWVERVRTTLVPMLDESAISIMLGPDVGSADVKFAVELGMSILLDKPIMVVALPGRKVPDKLRMLADAIVTADISTEAGQRELHAAITAMRARIG